MQPTKVQGWDVSLNHAAMVEFTDGIFTNWWFVTLKKNDVKRLKEHALFLPVGKPDKNDPHPWRIKRLDLWKGLLDDHLLMTVPQYVSLEDYAYKAKQQAHQIGEVGGLARLACWQAGVKLRLHDPTGPKMYATHNGNIDSDGMEEEVQKRWDLDFRQYNASEKNRDVSKDLAPAYALGHLLCTELSLRSGEILMNRLPPKEIQVFNRCTKRFPTNLLARDFIYNPEGGNCQLTP